MEFRPRSAPGTARETRFRMEAAANSLERACIRIYFPPMPAVTLKAHYDGERILLDEPYDLPPNAPLMVTVLPTAESVERADWARASAAGLARAYSDDEPEYTLDDLKP